MSERLSENFMSMLGDTARAHAVPLLDATLIALNMYGAYSDAGIPRLRMKIRPQGSREIWQVILPLESEASPFRIRNSLIEVEGSAVAEIVAEENDDVVLTYLRANGKSVTLNTNSRSNCVGCVFCPNIIEDAADETIRSEQGLAEVLEWLCADNDWGDLAHVEKITVCSGCFRTSSAAIAHMGALRNAASKLGFGGYLHLLSSVVRDKEDLARLVDAAGPFHLTFTLECFDRREILLKSTKASLTVGATCEALSALADLGALGDFTYIAGLDSLEVARRGLSDLIACATTFPRIQVYQAHNSVMQEYRHPEASGLGYYLSLRNQVEPLLAARGLRPQYWENYRPLWCSTFDQKTTTGPRI